MLCNTFSVKARLDADGMHIRVPLLNILEIKHPGTSWMTAACTLECLCAYRGQRVIVGLYTSGRYQDHFVWISYFNFILFPEFGKLFCPAFIEGDAQCSRIGFICALGDMHWNVIFKFSDSALTTDFLFPGDGPWSMYSACNELLGKMPWGLFEFLFLFFYFYFFLFISLNT